MDKAATGRRNERRGNYAVLMGVLVWVVIGFGALSVDVALITMSELQAQATADAASHAALVAFRENYNVSEGNQAASFIMTMDKVAMGTAIIEPGYPIYGQFDFQLGTFTPGLTAQGAANAVQVEVSRQNTNAVQLLLAPMYPIGIADHDVIADSITAQQMRAIEIVVDMSCSMMGGSSTSAVNISRIANLGFLDYLVTHPQDGDMLGITMFAQTAATAPSGGNTTGGSSDDGDSVPWQPLASVETKEQDIRDRINGICNTMNADQSSTSLCPAGWHPTTSTIGSCTNGDPALEQAIYQLVKNTDKTYFRGLVFFSDGEPNCSASGGWNVADATNRSIEEADRAWENDISVWTILFHNGSFDPAFMQNMVRGLGFSQVSPNAADMPKMYQQVVKSLPTALVQ